MTVRLGDVLGRLRDAGILRATDDALDPQAEIHAVTSDSRQAGPGTLFCAVRGTTQDGHRFLRAVQASGAVAALVEQPDPDAGLPQAEVSSGRLAAAHAAAALHGDPWNDLVLVGVTGTNGKTTSTAILRHLLGRRTAAASIGTLGAVGTDGRVVPGTEGLTTPGPVEFARWLRELRQGGAGAVAMEVSSHALDQDRVAAARFDAALFTNLTRDHLDYHGTLEAYRGAKLRLLDLLKPDGVAALNADDPAWDGARAATGRTLRFGMGDTADVRGVDVGTGPGGMHFTLRVPDGTAPVQLPLFGLYNVANALGAAAVLWGLGWPAAEIAEALATLPQVPGRLERVPAGQGAPTVLIDYAHTPDALERALAAVRPLAEGRVLVVFGAGGDRDRGKRPEMGRVAAAGADLAIVTSDNPRHEDPERIADDVERGMGSAPRRRVVDRREAIRTAIQLAGPGDIVLLAGKGHETYQIWGDERRPFDERIVVGEIFAEKGWTA